MSPVLVILLLSASLLSTGDSGKVLVFPVDESHWLNMKILLEALHSRGHEITVFRSSTSWYISEFSPLYTSITIAQEQPESIESQEVMMSFLNKSMEIRRNEGTIWAFFQFYRNLFNLFGGAGKKGAVKMVINIFENETLIRQLNETGYKLFLTDPEYPGGVLLAHYLKLPLVLNVRWIPGGEGHFAIAPSPLSYIPAVFSHFSDKMHFFQRLQNIVFHGMLVYMQNYVSGPKYLAVCDKYFGDDVNTLSLIQAADIWLMRVDFTFEFPRPTMPNVIYIGGFQGKPSKPLSADLEEFVQSSGEHGVIVMTLGTLLSDPGPEMSETFASAFASLPQKVLWRHVGKQPAALGNNTMLVKWLPQNDILGHPKTKVFITHGGTNSIYEAIYHGVPVLGIPLIFDQYDNIIRLKARGVAEIVDVTKMTVDSLKSALKSILDPEKPYKQNMVKLSELHHDKPMKPVDSAVFWIEYVMRHRGAPHLRSESYKLPWYAYHCLDVMAFCLAVMLLIILLIWVSCTACFSGLIRNRKSKLE